MKYQKIIPKNSISNIVQFFWNFEGDFSDVVKYQQSSVASIYPKLAFQYIKGMSILKDNKLIPLFKSGFQYQSNIYSEILSTQQVGIFGVFFKPYAIPVIFDIPSSEITNCDVEIYTILGREGRELEEQIFCCRSFEERVNIITLFIERKILGKKEEHNQLINLANFIINDGGLVNIQEITQDQFLSQRQFERKFKNLVGFSPKLFSRITRFENCITKIYNEKMSLTEASLLSGYFDQSHMIRDFKEFSGKNPSIYFSEDLSVFTKE